MKMRIEEISKSALADLNNSNLYALRLQFAQVASKYRRLQRDEPFISINWTELGEKYNVLHKEFEIRRLPIMSNEQKPEVVVELSGIHLPEPHGSLIYDGAKTLIVQSKYLRNVISRPLILVSGQNAYGVIRLNAPKAISLEEFSNLEKHHKISEEERSSWWPDKKILFAYTFDFFAKYPEPILIESSSGTPIIKQVKFIKNSKVWKWAKPGYRIFEIEDLKEIPGYKGKIVVDTKLDGVRIQVIKQNGEVEIWTDPDEVTTRQSANKTHRMPHQIEELRKLKADNFRFDAELVILNDGEALHRTAVNAWINAKRDPTEESERGHIVIFDVLELEKKDTRSFPLKERLEMFAQFNDTEHIHFIKPTTDLQKKSLSYILDANDFKGIKRITERLLNL